jgi:hypothetical protein
MTDGLATATATQPAETVLPGEGAPWTPPTWDEVVREHADRVYRLAYRLTGNPHDAEDLTQETFVRVFRNLASYRPGTFEGWLHRITTNLFLDMVRRRARIRMTPSASPAAAPSPSRSSPTPTSTRRCSPRSTRCRPSSAPPSSCATWRGCPTRRSAPRSA